MSHHEQRGKWALLTGLVLFLSACGGGGSDSGGGIQSSNVEFLEGGRRASLSVDLLTNGQDAFRQPGTSVTVGSEVVWAYIVQNTGAVALPSVKIYDRQGIPTLEEWNLVCEVVLQPGVTKQCSARGRAKPGLYRRDVAVQGVVVGDVLLRTNDRSFYTAR